MNTEIQDIKSQQPSTNRLRDSVSVFAPATVANVVCGFDVLGFAVNEPGDEVVMRMTNKPGITISKITGDNGRLPLNPAKNTVSVRHRAA
jgi:homoserine kinase